MTRMSLSVSLLVLLAAACGAGSNLPPDSECTRGTPESDIVYGAWQGPGMLADGGLPESSDVVVSTTFLALRTEPEAGQLFRDLMADISLDLASREGLIGYSISTSTRCNTARTLSVWADEAHMFTFAGSPAHGKAVRMIGSLSRGTSAVTHWHDSTANVSFQTAFGKIGAVDGVF